MGIERAFRRAAFLVVLLLASSASLGTAAAAVDLTGRWLVQYTDNFFGTTTFLEDWVQTGTTLTVDCVGAGASLFCHNIGTIDPLTGQFHFSEPGFPSFCGDNSLDGQGAPNGQTFTATSYTTVSVGTLLCKPINSEVVGSKCGNGVLDAGEECDDGNRASGDGCAANCTFGGCGDGVVAGFELCDDGNSDNTDACKNDCTPNVCGDGAVYAGVEECDDGNHVAGDGCSSTCDRERPPGGGPAGTDCVHEWATVPLPASGANGLPRNRVLCQDDDPACDFGAAVGDGMCTFHVGMCFNVTDGRLPCMPSDVHRVDLLAPGPASPNAANALNRTALEQALIGLGGSLQGACVGGAHKGQFCMANSACDAPAGSNGRCRRTVAFQPGLATVDTCTAVTTIVVPRHAAGSGRRVLRLGATPSNDPLTGQRTRDVDSLTLICLPPS